MRIYSLIMAISFSCGGGGKSDAGTAPEGTSEAMTDDVATGLAATTNELPTTGETASAADTENGETGDPTTLTTSGTTQASTDSSVSDTDTPITGEATAAEDTTGGETGTGGSAPDNAVVDDSCAPNDGAALEFRIGLDAAECGAAWTGGNLRVTLYQGGPLAPGVYPLDGGFGGASFEENQDLVFGGSGSLTIDEWTEEAVSGSYSLTFDDQSVRAGSFVGPHCLTMPMCG